MGVASGCGCKEVYRFPHTTYPYSSCICSCSIPTFFILCFSFLFQCFFVIKFYVLNKLFEQYKFNKLTHIQGNYGRPMAAI